MRYWSSRYLKMSNLIMLGKLTQIFLVVYCIVNLLPTDSVKYSYERLPIRRSIGKPVPWPKSLIYLGNSESDYRPIDKTSFKIEIAGNAALCEFVDRLTSRYVENSLLFDDIALPEVPKSENLQEPLIGLVVKDQGNGFKCESSPHEEMDESYELLIDPLSTLVELKANSSWGVLRGLETMSQLIFQIKGPDQFGVRDVKINDEPRFKHRGFLIDTSRHYISVKRIKQMIDGLSFNKLNLLHWHMFDDQSFPLELDKFPQLANKTIFRPHMKYSKKMVRDIIRYANDRGVRVMIELDSPGHTYSLRHIPNLLTPCYDTKTGQKDGDVGPVNPIANGTYKKMGALIYELTQLFNESMFHSGGDEVEYECWRSNPDINKWLIEHNIENEYKELSNYYLRRIYDILNFYNRTMIVWQEVFDDNADLPKDTVIHVWKDLNLTGLFMSELKRVVESGYRAILSSCWYLNYIDYGQDWVKFYKCDPLEKPYIEKEYEHLVLGGEICMWSEFVDDTNIISRSWPRSSAAAERLWSPADKMDTDEFETRLEQIRCRLNFRGIEAEPVVGPGFC